MMRALARLALALFFSYAGTSHFTNPRPFARIVPPPLPAMACVYASGVLEILGGLGLLRWPKPAAWLLTIVLIGVFPANLYMAVAGVKFNGFPSQPWMAWARLPLQPLLIALVLWAGGVL